MKKSESLEVYQNGPIKPGDRVIIKGKYTGLCKYVGPIIGAVNTTEVFVGIKLDDCLTRHSGVFDDKKYFECEVGYGIMVPFRKVKCIRSKHLDSPKKLESDAAVREVVELGRVLHKVSPGYQFVKHMQTTNSQLKTGENGYLQPTLEILDAYQSYQKTVPPLSRLCSGTEAFMLYDQMGLEFPNYQSYDQLARSFGRISLGKSPPLERRKKSSFTAATFTPNYSDENETLKSLSMTESHYSSNMMSSPAKSVSSVKSYTKKKRRRSSAAKKEIEFVRSVSSGSSGIESMSSLDGHSTSSRRSSSSKLDEYDQPILKSYLRLQQTICSQCSNCNKCDELVRNTSISLDENKENAKKTPRKKKTSSRRGSSMPRPSYNGLPSDRYNSVSDPTRSMTIGMRRQIDKLMVAIEG